MQCSIGSCTPGDVGLRVIVTIIGHHPEKSMLLIDAGWTALSAQGVEHGYGIIEGAPYLQVGALKQEVIMQRHFILFIEKLTN